MNAWKNKWIMGFLTATLITSMTLGAVIWHFGSNYEKTASVYMKSLDWALPLSTDYQHISIDRETENQYRCLSKEQVDFRDTSGQLLKSENPTDTTSYIETHDRLGWKSYQGRKIGNIYAVDENTYAVSFKGQTADEYGSSYLLLDKNMKPVLGDRMFEVILEESDDMRYFVNSEKDFDGKAQKKECGFLDASGNVVFTFDHVPVCVNSFSEGLALVYDDKLYAYNKAGNIVFSLDYTGEGIIASQRENHEEDTTYSPYYTRFVNGLAPITLDGASMGYINRKGNFVIEPLFQEAGIVLDATAAVCLIQSDHPSTLVKSRWGILDLRGVQ